MTCAYRCDRSAYHATQLAGIEPGCQFGEDAPLFEYNERRWCAFHLPEGAKLQWTARQKGEFAERVASSIRDAIEAKTDLDFTGSIFAFEFRLHPGNEPLELPRVLFIGCVFMEDVEIENVVFGQEAYFDDAIFRKQALLGENTFLGDARFNGADLGPNVHFGGNHFHLNAYFQGTRFSSNFWCSDVQFEGRAWFQGSTFAGIAYFEDCKVNGEFDFSTSTPAENETSLPDITFEGTVFRDRASFVNRAFSRPASFSKCVFHVAPEFHGCRLHQDTDFSGAKFMDKGNAKRQVVHDIAPTEVDAERAYRTLKWAMEAARNLEYEMLFYSLEQAALRKNPDVSKSVKALSLLYWLTCDYGRNIHRPFLLLLGVLAIGVGAESLLLSGSTVQITNVNDAIRFTLVHISDPTALIKEAKAPIGAALVWFGVSLVSLTLLLLAAISIRRRFRLGQ